MMQKSLKRTLSPWYLRKYVMLKWHIKCSQRANISISVLSLTLGSLVDRLVWAMGTEHLMVCLLDRILQLLDKNTDRSADIMKQVDWSAAFDRLDPTKGIEKFIKMGVRPSLIPLLASYLTDRRMQVKFNGEMSEFLTLIGGGPQGTLLGQIEYLV